MPPSQLEQAIMAARADQFLHAMTMFIDVYGSDEAPIRTPKDASGLSWFGLTIAMMQRKFKPAIDLCRRAIELEFYNGDHYANLARVYIAAGNRKKALETIDQGQKLIPDHDYLAAVRTELGVRARPAVPFLTRENPINVSLGQARHAKKVADQEKKRSR